MKNLTEKYCLFLLLACAFAGKIEATRIADAGNECCRSSCYECSCEPLYPCAWDVQLHAGVAPILWRDRGELVLVGCAFSDVTPVTNVLDMPKFSRFFHTPWTIGAQVGFAWDCNIRLYAEFDYVRARAKCIELSFANLPQAATLTPVFGKYEYYDFFVGARYYWDRWCDRASIFLGGKLGLRHHRNVCFDNILLALPENEFTVFNNNLFTRNTKFAAGGNIGIDICFCGNWSAVITAEVVASCGPHSNGTIVLSDSSNLLNFNLFFGHITTELTFPVTFGIRYSF